MEQEVRSGNRWAGWVASGKLGRLSRPVWVKVMVLPCESWTWIGLAVGVHQTKSTARTPYCILAGFMASHPQVSMMHQEILISLAQFTFLLEVEAQANYEKDKESRKQIDFSWLTLHKIASCSPSASSLTNWVTELAKEQFIIFSAKMANAYVFCQSNVGKKGQEVR
jgi:hypothetical protein